MKKKSQLRLYVFENFEPDYTGGLAFAIASSEGDAKRQIMLTHGYSVHDWGSVSKHRLDRRIARAVSGGS